MQIRHRRFDSDRSLSTEDPRDVPEIPGFAGVFLFLDRSRAGRTAQNPARHSSPILPPHAVFCHLMPASYPDEHPDETGSQGQVNTLPHPSSSRYWALLAARPCPPHSLACSVRRPTIQVRAVPLLPLSRHHPQPCPVEIQKLRN